ncbi:uncharacterized protein K460DRAFT_351007 [Cucurbitaria berberidis CBS 394.84]|uniref:Uncharacterized protein n=1 Tax=Cucurbitaria berberidis CBS 394.84 TaxID=1168544 RepID=A0A9P4LDH7_9PLEO|nr:uncharacterized protein K460DRAFT_351007 [Cucurbitaria berberidis CBS 394.84]KAF1851030.1 hypothetical protein K460DRAFT_351007 [Cucurbitaria berberidis CBS 394.84]
MKVYHSFLGDDSISQLQAKYPEQAGGRSSGWLWAWWRRRKERNGRKVRRRSGGRSNPSTDFASQRSESPSQYCTLNARRGCAIEIVEVGGGVLRMAEKVGEERRRKLLVRDPNGISRSDDDGNRRCKDSTSLSSILVTGTTALYQIKSQMHHASTGLAIPATARSLPAADCPSTTSERVDPQPLGFQPLYMALHRFSRDYYSQSHRKGSGIGLVQHDTRQADRSPASRNA